MTIFVGVDPGLSGAIVALDHGGRIMHISLMPIGIEELPDYDELVTIFRNLRFTYGEKNMHIYVERAVSFGMGLTGAFNYGQGFGILRCSLRQLMLPYTLIEPRKWTKEIYQGIDQNLKPKVQAQIAVERLFPKAELPIVGKKTKKPHEGVVDALLISEYGRRQALSAKAASL